MISVCMVEIEEKSLCITVMICDFAPIMVEWQPRGLELEAHAKFLPAGVFNLCRSGYVHRCDARQGATYVGQQVATVSVTVFAVLSVIHAVV